jgi:cytosine/adenosine deaminase-related metal-dependent hydrolase
LIASGAPPGIAAELGQVYRCLERLAPQARIALVLHRRVAERFETELDAQPNAVLIWEAARHWELAGDPERARAAIVHGAEHLFDSGFPSEAAIIYERIIGETGRAAARGRGSRARAYPCSRVARAGRAVLVGACAARVHRDHWRADRKRAGGSRISVGFAPRTACSCSRTSRARPFAAGGSRALSCHV